MAHRGCGFTPLPLPCHGEPILISEISSSRSFEAKTTGLNGKTVRVVGRVRAYDPISQVLLLVEPSKSTSSTSLGSSSKLSRHDVPDNVLVVDTRLTDGLDCCCGSQVMFIGELEKWSDSRLAGICEQVAMNLDLQVPNGQSDSNSWKGDIVMKAVISKCVDRLDYSLYLQCIPVWRGGDVG